MNPAMRVLLGSIVGAVLVVGIVLYRYDLLSSKEKPAESTTAAMKAPAESMASAPESKPAAAPTESAPPEDLALGKKLYEEKTCVLCHGADGKAQTPTGVAMKATDLSSGQFHSNKANMEPVAYIKQVIEAGVPGTAMVGFQAQIPDEKDRSALAQYVHSLSKKK